MRYKEHRVHLMTHLYDTRDLVRKYRDTVRKKENALSREDFRKVVAMCNDLLMENALNGFVSELPEGMGKFYLVHFKKKYRKNNPVNWGKTKKLWKENPELEKKTFIKQEHNDCYMIYYDTENCNYRHSDIVRFYAGKDLKQKIRDKSNEGKMNAVEADDYLKNKQ